MALKPYRVPTRMGKKTTAGTVYRGFLVHRTVRGKGWTVTHIPTMRGVIFNIESFRLAKRMVTGLHIEGFDPSASIGELKQAGKDWHQAVSEVIHWVYMTDYGGADG